MDRRHRRRGFVAAAGMALLVADVRGFAFTLQHRAATGRSTPTAVGGRAATREASSRGSGSVAAAAPWGSRRPRTALRCVCVCVCTRRGLVLDVEVDELQQQLFQPPGRSPCNGPHDLRCASQQESLRRVAGWGLTGSGSCRGTNRSTAFEHACEKCKVALSLSHSLSEDKTVFFSAARFMLMSLALFMFLRWPCGPPSWQITKKLYYTVYRIKHLISNM